MDEITNTQDTKIADSTPSVCKVHCITELKPWATVQGEGLRPLDLDEIVSVPANEGAMLQQHRHAIIVG